MLENLAASLIGFLGRLIPHLGHPHPVVNYGLVFNRNAFVLDVRVGNRGSKPLFVSEVWLWAPKHSQGFCIFREHDTPHQIDENGGRVYKFELSIENAKPFAIPGGHVEMIDATGRTYVKKLARKTSKFLGEDVAARMRGA